MHSNLLVFVQYNNRLTLGCTYADLPLDGVWLTTESRLFRLTEAFEVTKKPSNYSEIGLAHNP